MIKDGNKRIMVTIFADNLVRLEKLKLLNNTKQNSKVINWCIAYCMVDTKKGD